MTAQTASLPDPYYKEPGITIYHADCRDVLPYLPKVDLVLTDPPYGIDIGGAGSIGGAGIIYPKDYGVSDWDKRPMSQEQWALIQPKAPLSIIWGGNYLADKLGPSKGVLIWDKRCQNGWDDSFSECEIAWTNIFTRSKAFRHLWAGALRASEQGANIRQHPTQKPLALLVWCLSLTPGATSVLDPFMGSGTTLAAAKLLGRKAIGIEIERKYCDIAIERLRQEMLPFDPLIPQPEQLELYV